MKWQKLYDYHRQPERRYCDNAALLHHKIKETEIEVTFIGEVTYWCRYQSCRYYMLSLPTALISDVVRLLCLHHNHKGAVI